MGRVASFSSRCGTFRGIWRSWRRRSGSPGFGTGVEGLPFSCRWLARCLSLLPQLVPGRRFAPQCTRQACSFLLTARDSVVACQFHRCFFRPSQSLLALAPEDTRCPFQSSATTRKPKHGACCLKIRRECWYSELPSSFTISRPHSLCETNISRTIRRTCTL
jgi:hypothetical protein